MSPMRVGGAGPIGRPKGGVAGDAIPGGGRGELGDKGEAVPVGEGWLRVGGEGVVEGGAGGGEPERGCEGGG